MRKVIITGSEGLFGKHISKFFENSDCEVVRLDLSLGHDLNDESFVRNFFRENKAKYLINLFALNDHVDMEKETNNLFDITIDSFEAYMKVNVTSLFSVCREFARNNDAGCIVNFSSTYGIVSPSPHLYNGADEKHIGYSVSKSAVAHLTKHLAVHLAPNFRVNCIAPGGVRHEQDEEFVRKYSDKTPMARMMRVSELDGLLDFLCSENSSYMTGETITVDGGWTKW